MEHKIFKTFGRVILVALLPLQLCSCASLNRNATAVVLGGTLGAAGAVGGFAISRGNTGAAVAGGAVGTAIGTGIGHQIDKVIFQKEQARVHAVCPNCDYSVHVGGLNTGQKIYCQDCGHRCEFQEVEAKNSR